MDGLMGGDFRAWAVAWPINSIAAGTNLQAWPLRVSVDKHKGVRWDITIC
jgi:hypothetical protein